MNISFTKAKLMKQEVERAYGSKFKNCAGYEMQINFLRLIHFFVTTSVFSSQRTSDLSLWINSWCVRIKIYPSVKKNANQGIKQDRDLLAKNGTNKG